MGEPPVNNNGWTIGIDLGGTSFKCGLVSPDFEISARRDDATRPQDGPDATADRIAAQVRELLAERPSGVEITHAGICTPGPVDHARGLITDAPNLVGWRDVPLAAMLTERLGLPFILEHDAKAAALGEYHLGAGRGHRDMALIIVGTGVGSAMVVNGQLYRGTHNSAGEVGHITVNLDGPLCTCGSYGCVEAYAGGPAIMHAYAHAARREVESAQVVVQAAEQGDELAQRVLTRAGRALGAGMAAIAMLMDIDLFVLFGGVVQAGEWIITPARAALAAYALDSVASRVRVRVGELGNDAGILGVVWAARHP